MKRAFVILLVLGWLFYVYSIQQPAGSNASPDRYITSHAQPYTVVQEDVWGYPGRVRIHYEIISQNAMNFEQFVHTSVQAAVDKWQATKADVIYITLNPSPGLVGFGDAYAIARYASDGGGHSGIDGWIWDVEAVNRPYTDQEISIAELWFSYREQFLEGNGASVNEPWLKAFIGEELDISEDEVRLPYRSRKKYVPVLAD